MRIAIAPRCLSMGGTISESGWRRPFVEVDRTAQDGDGFLVAEAVIRIFEPLGHVDALNPRCADRNDTPLVTPRPARRRPHPETGRHIHIIDPVVLRIDR